MKSEFDASSVYLHRDDRIKAQFLTCFISLMIYRILEKQLDNSFTCEEINGFRMCVELRELHSNGAICVSNDGQKVLCPSYHIIQLS